MFENFAFCHALYQRIKCLGNCHVSDFLTVVVFWSRNPRSWIASVVAAVPAQASNEKTVLALRTPNKEWEKMETPEKFFNVCFTVFVFIQLIFLNSLIFSWSTFGFKLRRKRFMKFSKFFWRFGIAPRFCFLASLIFKNFCHLLGSFFKVNGCLRSFQKLLEFFEYLCRVTDISMFSKN